MVQWVENSHQVVCGFIEGERDGLGQGKKKAKDIALVILLTSPPVKIYWFAAAIPSCLWISRNINYSIDAILGGGKFFFLILLLWLFGQRVEKRDKHRKTLFSYFFFCISPLDFPWENC